MRNQLHSYEIIKAKCDCIICCVLQIMAHGLSSGWCQSTMSMDPCMIT